MVKYINKGIQLKRFLRDYKRNMNIVLNISYCSIVIYVAEKKRELNLDTIEYLKSSHLPGTAQVDFDKLTFKQDGKDVKGIYLVLTLPYSNAGYVNETIEYLLQGLKDIFKHIGGVLREIWFDNLTAVVAFRKKKTEF